MNNYQINSEAYKPSQNTIAIGQVTCQGPSFTMGVGVLPNSYYDSWGNYGSNYQPNAQMGFTFPLGGAIAQCRQQATLINQRTAFAFATDQLEQCVKFAEKGVDFSALDPKLFGNLGTMCKSVVLSRPTSTKVYVPPSQEAPPKNEPVRGLW